MNGHSTNIVNTYDITAQNRKAGQNQCNAFMSGFHWHLIGLSLRSMTRLRAKRSAAPKQGCHFDGKDQCGHGIAAPYIEAISAHGEKL